ncbi:hypothetical protein GDO78_016631 [Eleutherodactylus coqui]|uniref:Uncharacterized protein n=1 Tax=Eleutherodactylus coqui TaxID=57060 RepID=A0A8J6B095_ELECQ|nr:hypothetical protein GDO78_016631 [Eleutherodactylus coqui]
MSVISRKIHMKTIFQVHLQPFIANISQLILLYMSYLLIHRRLMSRIKVTEGENNKLERSRIHVQNVGNVLLGNHILFNMRKVTQERDHFHVQNVGNVLF